MSTPTETPTIVDEKQNFEELRAKKQEIDKLMIFAINYMKISNMKRQS